MTVNNPTIEKNRITDILTYAISYPNVAIIHYINDKNQKKTFIGLEPTKTIIESSNNQKPTDIEKSLTNENCVWVIATTYEWGSSQLNTRLTQESPIAIYKKYESGFWINHQTESIESFGPISIQKMINKSIKEKISLIPLWTFNNFKSAILKTKKAIKEGDIYQVNISYPCELISNMTVKDIYSEISKLSTPSHSAYLGGNDYSIASFSPEEFFYINNGIIRTSPIKGTIGRSKSESLDKIAYQTLKESKKDHTELVMITDLLRNDIGQFCKFGSVTVNNLCDIKPYDYVYHLESKITGNVNNTPILDILSKLSPGGSISGCPKYSACKIINDIEPFPRQFYTGHIGFISSSNEAAFNVAIRTCYQWKDQPIKTHTGCGITIESDPALEYQESIDKLRFITDYIQTKQ